MMKLKFAFTQKCLRVAVTQRNRRRRRDREALVLASLSMCRKIGERERENFSLVTKAVGSPWGILMARCVHVSGMARPRNGSPPFGIAWAFIRCEIVVCIRYDFSR